MKMKINFLSIILFLSLKIAIAQDSTSKTYITSSVGVLVPLSKFANAYEKSLALTSGFGYKLPKNFIAEFGFEFNAVKYNQVVLDANSNFLFKNTNSSILMAGISLLKKVPLNSQKSVFLAPYIGFGYTNIGEPRLNVNLQKNIISQSTRRMQGVYAKSGLKLIIKTKSKMLKTVFLDPSIWSSSIRVQGSSAQAFTLRAGTIIGF
jgi:hypothetical protein